MLKKILLSLFLLVIAFNALATEIGVQAYTKGAYIEGNGYSGYAEGSDTFEGEVLLLSWSQLESSDGTYSGIDTFLDPHVVTAQAAGKKIFLHLRYNRFNACSWASTTKVPSYIKDGLPSGTQAMSGTCTLPHANDDFCSGVVFNPRTGASCKGVIVPRIWTVATNTSHPEYDGPNWGLVNNKWVAGELIQLIRELRNRYQDVAAFQGVLLSESGNIVYDNDLDTSSLNAQQLCDLKIDTMIEIHNAVEAMWPESLNAFYLNYLGTDTCMDQAVAAFRANGANISTPDGCQDQANNAALAALHRAPGDPWGDVVIMPTVQGTNDVMNNCMNRHADNYEGLYDHLFTDADGWNAHISFMTTKCSDDWNYANSNKGSVDRAQSDCANPSPNQDNLDWYTTAAAEYALGNDGNETIPANISGGVTGSGGPPFDNVYMTVGSPTNVIDGNITWIGENYNSASESTITVTDATAVTNLTGHAFGDVPQAVVGTHRRHQATNIGATMQWDLPMNEATYDLYLVFSEPAASFGNDSREFTIDIDGGVSGTQTTETDFDIFELTGADDTLYVKTFSSVVVDSSDNLEIKLTNEPQDRSILQGIVVLESATPALGTPTITSTNPTGETTFDINFTVGSGTPTSHDVLLDGIFHQNLVDIVSPLNVTGAQAYTSYNVTIVAKVSGGSSAVSNAVTVLTQDNTAPSVPGDPQVVTSGNDNTITWNPSTDTGSGVLHYDLDIDDCAGGAFGDLATISAGTEVYNDTGRGPSPPAADCIYRIRAKDNQNNNSSYSSNFSAGNEVPTCSNFTVFVRNGDTINTITLGSFTDPEAETLLHTEEDLSQPTNGTLTIVNNGVALQWTGGGEVIGTQDPVDVVMTDPAGAACSAEMTLDIISWGAPAL